MGGQFGEHWRFSKEGIEFGMFFKSKNEGYFENFRAARAFLLRVTWDNAQNKGAILQKMPMLKVGIAFGKFCLIFQIK